MNYGILSERGYMYWASWDVVYEWEDVIARYNGITIKTFRTGTVGRFIRRGIRDINKIARKNLQYTIKDSRKVDLLFVMNATIYRNLPTSNIIPIFLDFPESMIDEIIFATKQIPLFFVTCTDIYNMLIERHIKNVRYMPLSISDKHCCDEMPAKSIDVIQFGRKNEILHKYMLRYCRENPDIEYVYQTADGSLTYCSTLRGDIGKFDSREDYLDMVSKCRISLVSSPGCDNSRANEFGNIDFITPRFYESAALYCHMIGRYTENEETKNLGLSKICPCVREYEEFKTLVDEYLGKNSEKQFDWSLQKKFVDENRTSMRAQFIHNQIDVTFG